MKLLKALAKAYLKAVALLFVTGFIIGAIQGIYQQITARKGTITPRQFARMKRNIRVHMKNYSSRIR